MRRRKRRTGKKPLLAAVMFVTAAVFLSGTVFVKTVVEPNMENAARMKAEALVSRTISKTLSQQLRGRKREALFSPLRKALTDPWKWFRPILWK